MIKKNIDTYVLKGTDRDLQMIAYAKANADRAGVGHLVSRERKALAERAHRDGMVVSNPPYGQRLDQDDIAVVHEDLIALLEQDETRGGFITSYDIGTMDLDKRKYETRWNGGEEVKLWKRK
jgi:23S rRNA G2445 N2-methylase RlmL